MLIPCLGLCLCRCHTVCDLPGPQLPEADYSASGAGGPVAVPPPWRVPDSQLQWGSTPLLPDREAHLTHAGEAARGFARPAASLALPCTALFLTQRRSPTQTCCVRCLTSCFAQTLKLCSQNCLSVSSQFFSDFLLFFAMNSQRLTQILWAHLKDCKPGAIPRFWYISDGIYV